MSITVGSTLSEVVGINYAETVGGAMELTVGAVMSIGVGGALVEAVGLNRTETIGGGKSVTVGSQMTVEVGKNLTESIGESRTVNIKKDLKETIEGRFGNRNQTVYVEGKEEILFNADDEISFKTGSAEIVLQKNGDIILKGAKMQIKGSGDVIIKGSNIKQN